MSSSTRLQRSSLELIKFLLNHLDHRVVRPSLKAFLYAYLYVTLPKVLNRFVLSIRAKKYLEIAPRTVKILVNALNPLKFPFFAAKLIAGINLLEPIVYKLLKKSGMPRLGKNPVNNLFLSTLISSFVSSLISFPFFQNHIITYGRYYLLDLTLLAATRACDTALSSTLAKFIQSDQSFFRHIDGNAILFIVSCSFIMFAWFFRPHKLPPSYRKWITSAANMDQEIIDALKYLRDGTLIYGAKCEHQDVLNTYCDRHKQDRLHGSLITNQPLLCYTVHAFRTTNCEVHALWRFVRGFEFAAKIYGPLNVLLLLVPMKGVSMRSRVIRALKSSIRSSCFLGAFISLYWYAVCLGRKRLFPKLFPQYPLTMWDVTIAPTAGAIACGFSLFVETVQRRKELALFVAPRALGTIIPNEPSLKNLRIESIVFSVSMAVLVAYSKSDATSVRGVFGKGLKQVLSIDRYQ